MSSPIQLMTISAIYLLMVRKFGPSFMQNRPAYELKTLTRIYNLIQIILCFYNVFFSFNWGFTFTYLWKCGVTPNATDQVTPEMIKFFNFYWWFMIVRMSEFLETIFFVLRKKQNQVSILHVYHHIAVVMLLWLFLKYDSGKLFNIKCIKLIDLTFIFFDLRRLRNSLHRLV